MAGTARIVVGIILVIIGVVTLIFLIGILPLIIGILLIIWGLDARRREAADQLQQQAMAQQTALLQQMAATQATQRQSVMMYPGTFNPSPSPQIPAPPRGGAAAAERYCTSCGSGNARTAAFCQKCGNPLPPPP